MSDERKGKHKQVPGENHPQDAKRPPRKGSGRNRPAKGYLKGFGWVRSKKRPKKAASESGESR